MSKPSVGAGLQALKIFRAASIHKPRWSRALLKPKPKIIPNRNLNLTAQGCKATAHACFHSPLLTEEGLETTRAEMGPWVLTAES